MILVCFAEKKLDSDRFILSSYRAYCRLTGLAAKNYTVDRTQGKPFLRAESGDCADVFFSLSHSGKFIACAIGDSEVGFDIQIHKDVDFLSLSRRLFNCEIVDKNVFFDRFAQGEAKAKSDDCGLLNGMTKGGGKNFRLFDGYSVAVCGGSEPVFFTELYMENEQ